MIKMEALHRKVDCRNSIHIDWDADAPGFKASLIHLRTKRVLVTGEPMPDIISSIMVLNQQLYLLEED